MADANANGGKDHQPKTIIYGIVVVFRRGPTRHTRLLCWDLRNDTLRVGQWLVGTLQLGTCGVSPNGELLVYDARKGRLHFTAVSRPPYFTALAFWEHRSPWSGGGFFPQDNQLVTGVMHNPDKGSLPAILDVTNVWAYFPWSGNERSTESFADAVRKAPEAHQGWRISERGLWQKLNPCHSWLRLERNGAAQGRPGAYQLDGTQPANAKTAGCDLGTLDWADWGHDGALLFGRQGCLYRQRMNLSLAAVFEPPFLVADLTEQRFERVLAPDEARRWPPKLTGLKRRRG